MIWVVAFSTIMSFQDFLVSCPEVSEMWLGLSGLGRVRKLLPATLYPGTLVHLCLIQLWLCTLSIPKESHHACKNIVSLFSCAYSNSAVGKLELQFSSLEYYILSTHGRTISDEAVLYAP